MKLIGLILASALAESSADGRREYFFTMLLGTSILAALRDAKKLASFRQAARSWSGMSISDSELLVWCSSMGISVPLEFSNPR